MIITDEKENQIIINLLKMVADDCNLYWKNEKEIDPDKKEYESYLKLKEKLDYYMNTDELKNIDLMSILYKFKQI